MAKKIMIIDDDPVIVKYLETLFSNNGYKTCVAVDGSEGINVLKREKPDLITLDVLLPDANGFSILKMLQEDERTKDIPVIFVTVREEKEKGIKMGASGYIVKPFNEGELKGTIKSILT